MAVKHVPFFSTIEDQVVSSIVTFHHLLTSGQLSFKRMILPTTVRGLQLKLLLEEEIFSNHLHQSRDSKPITKLHSFQMLVVVEQNCQNAPDVAIDIHPERCLDRESIRQCSTALSFHQTSIQNQRPIMESIVMILLVMHLT